VAWLLATINTDSAPDLDSGEASQGDRNPSNERITPSVLDAGSGLLSVVAYDGVSATRELNRHRNNCSAILHSLRTINILYLFRYTLSNKNNRSAILQAALQDSTPRDEPSRTLNDASTRPILLPAALSRDCLQ
jgi:hypothetical protein